jgi:hypothetical protein
MTHEVISLRGQLDLQCQVLRHDKNIFHRNMCQFKIAAVPTIIHIPSGICITLGWQQQHQEYYISLQNGAKMFNPQHSLLIFLYALKNHLPIVLLAHRPPYHHHDRFRCLRYPGTSSANCRNPPANCRQRVDLGELSEVRLQCHS